MTTTTILDIETDSKTLETLIAETKAALASMPRETNLFAMLELQAALAGPSWMMITGDEIEQAEGFRLYSFILADFLENFDIWFSCPRVN